MTRFSRQHSYVGTTLEVVLLISAVVSVFGSSQSATSTSTLSSQRITATIAPTRTSSVAMTTTIIAATPSPTRNISFSVMIQFVNISWKIELLDKTSPAFIALEEDVTKAVENVIRENFSVVNVEVEEFRPGSVLAFLNIQTTLAEQKVKEILFSQISSGELNGLQVSRTLFSGTLFDVVLKIKAECDDSQELKGFKQSQNLTNAVQEQLLGNETVTVQKVSCPAPQNVTMVTIRLQIRNATSINPNTELNGLRKVIETGQLGSFPLLSEWQAYLPGEKLFSVSFDLKSTPPSEDKSQTIEDLKAAIEALLGSHPYFRYITLELKNSDTTVFAEIGMKASASDQPNEALKTLKESVSKGSVGYIKVKATSFEAYINRNTLTQRVFGVHFRVNMSNCNEGDVGQNQFARNLVQDYIQDYLRQFKSRNLFIDAKLQSLQCVKGHILRDERFVQAEFWVYLKPETPDKRGQFLGALYKCRTEIAIKDWGVKIVSLTPTSSSVKPLYTHYVCGWSPKPAATTSASTEPTKESVSSRTPTIELSPSLYVKIKSGITWEEFCSKLEHGLKQKIAWSLNDQNGTGVSPDRIVFINVEENCADPSKKDEQAEVWFYVSDSGSKKLHKSLTLKAYKLLKKLLENGNTKQLGPELEGKVIHVDLAGESSSQHRIGFDAGKLSTLAVILIAVAGAVGLLLLTVACCCVFCCGANRRKRRKGEDSQALHVIRVDANGTDGITEGKEPKADEQKNKDSTDSGDESNKDKRNKENKKESDDVGKESDVSYENQADVCGLEGNDDDQNSSQPVSGVAPLIVTSPAPDCDKIDDLRNANTGGQFSDTASSGSGGSRRGSASIGGEGQGSGSKPPSPATLQRIDADLRDRGRRRSSGHPIIDDEDVPLTHKTGTVGIVALALRNRNEIKKEAEFKNLNKNLPEEEVKYPANTQSKNRSPDVLPAPKTRVKLSSNPDYINANWIRDHKGQRRYIATQHPLHETAEDFWRMVWEQESRLVVMVNEQKKEKPAEFMDYLPRGEENTKNFGGIEVTVKQILQKSDYTLTTLRMTGSKKSSAREVSHMKFTSWKERAMPNVALFVGFVTATREERKRYGDTKAPVIVHCSDGLGFTGVYIAVDIGIKSHEESKTSVVDVFELSKNLRHDRHGIVCSLDHYNFIYQALYEYTVNYDASAEAQKR